MAKRDLEFLKRIVPHGHVTLDVLLRWFPGLSLSAGRSWIKRLRASHWLESAPLDEHRCYYRLSNKAVVFLRTKHGIRVSRAATRPLKPLRKPERHAFLLYTSHDVVPRPEPYRPAFDSERFPEIAAVVASGKADPLRQKLFYSQGTVVGYFVLDRSHPTFVSDKLLPKVQMLWKWEAFERLCTDGLFALTVVTTSVTRARELTAVINRDAPPFRWEVVVMEEIAALLPRRRNWNLPQTSPQETSQ